MNDAQVPVAVLSKVEKAYQLDAVSVPVIRGVDLLIRPAHFTVLLGPSGSGKTTLLNMLGCIDRPDTGSVTVAGNEVNAMTDDELSDFRAKNIGFIFQNFNLLPVLSAYENIEYPLVLAGTSAKVRGDRVPKLLEAVGLSDKARNLPGQLSGHRARAGPQAQAGDRRRAHSQPRQPDRRGHPVADAAHAGTLPDLVHVFVARPCRDRCGRRHHLPQGWRDPGRSPKAT
jgi:putative ABC transport system ATP-binding protein